MFIEVNVGTIDRTLVNLENLHKVMPARSGAGSILYFSDGRTQNVLEGYETLKTVLTKPTVSVLPEETKPINKKEIEKAKS
jgi:hypothetical protein